MTRFEDMQLPKINEKRQKADELYLKLGREIYETILRVERENGYLFRPFEVHYVLSRTIMLNNQGLIDLEVGYKQI